MASVCIQGQLRPHSRTTQQHRTQSYPHLWPLLPRFPLFSALPQLPSHRPSILMRTHTEDPVAVLPTHINSVPLAKCLATEDRGQSESLRLLSDPQGLAENWALASAQDRPALQALFPVQTWSWAPELSSTGPEGSFQTEPPKQSLVVVARPACTSKGCT